MLEARPTTYMLARALLFGATLLAPVGAQVPASEETIAFFQLNCTSCHTIGGGRLAGPDLKGVAQRREKDWLIGFIQDPKGTIDSGDAYAQALLGDARGVYMPNIPGLDRTLASKLVDLIEAESGLEKSRFAGLQISDRALTQADVERGQALFMGATRFLERAPACVSCHTLSAVSGLGGGLLGPDLTSAYSRLEGRKALSAWLASPPSAVMQPVFAGHALDSEEILALVAFLQEASATGEAGATTNSMSFVLAGIAAAAVLLVLFDVFWKTRFRSVRRALLANN